MKYLDSAIKRLAEINLLNFCSLFSSKINLNAELDLFSNEFVENDYFFNKVYVKKNNIKLEYVTQILKSLKNKKGQKINHHFFIYLNKNLIIKTEKLHKNLVKIDKIIFLKSPEEIAIENQNSKKFKMMISASFEKHAIYKWTKIFCSIFNLPQLKETFPSIIMNNTDKLIPITSHLKMKNTKSTYATGCGMMFDDGLSIGMYCLGTMPKYRNIGIGKSILKFGLYVAKSKGYKFFTLQTFEKDEILCYYIRKGFKVIDEKDIYIF